MINEIPNQSVIFESDPDQKPRKEDDLLSYAWAQYLKDPDHNIRWLPRFQMVKAAFQCMRAAHDFMEQEYIAQIDGWVTLGASKRGWTTWLTGVTSCSNCPKVRGIMPMVPIEPDFMNGVHHMWKSFGAFTFEFDDYVDKKIIIPQFDSDTWKEADKVLDPLYYDNLDQIPKLIMVASNDQFMIFDWTSMWWPKMGGEKHLVILPNTDHGMHTNAPKQVSALAWFIKRIKHHETDNYSFTSSFDEQSGKLSIDFASDAVKPVDVLLRHTETLSNKTRDFRWNSMPDKNGECPPPAWRMTKGEKMCYQPIFWMMENSEKHSDSSYSMTVPPPIHKDGRWQGLFAEVQFATDMPTGNWYLDLWVNPKQFSLTSPGFVTPSTFPFPDCHLDTCTNTEI